MDTGFKYIQVIEENLDFIKDLLLKNKRIYEISINRLKHRGFEIDIVFVGGDNFLTVKQGEWLVYRGDKFVSKIHSVDVPEKYKDK